MNKADLKELKKDNPGSENKIEETGGILVEETGVFADNHASHSNPKKMRSAGSRPIAKDKKIPCYDGTAGSKIGSLSARDPEDNCERSPVF